MKDKSTNRLFLAIKFLHPAKRKRNLLLQLVFTLFFIGTYCTVYAQPTVLGTEIVNGNYVTYDLTTVGGFKQVRILALNNAIASALKWEFATGTAASTNYTTNWRPYTGGQTLSGYNTFIDPATATASARYNTGSGGQGGLLPAVTAGNYYTFNITNNAASNNNMSVLETTYNPETITSVTQSPATVGAVVSPTITVTTSAAPQANVYVRYSTDNFVTSTLVQLSFVGATGTAVIPAQAAGQTVKYYIYNSPKTSAQITTDVTSFGQSAHDMATLNLNNNANANYSYTVLPVTVNATNVINDASYSTLKAAFDAINLATHTGIINVTIGGNTTEVSSAVLNAGAYTSVTVKPSGVRTVTGNLAAPLVDLNGADNVTIDGLNDVTNTLTFTNSSTSNAAGTSTIRMYNGATINTVQNCTIEGSTLSTADGVIMFGTGTNATIAITSNTIRPAGANLPIYGVYASGTSNTAISITSNNIQDYFSATVSSSGINANTGSDAWTISSNKFYQSAARAVTITSAVVIRAIYVTVGGGHTITSNTIGYANSAGTGTTSYSNTVASNNTLITAIELAGNATVSSIQGNVITNIAITNTGAVSSFIPGLFTGIYVSSGAANIGNATGNTIGASTGTGSISITFNSIAAQIPINAIYTASLAPNSVNIQNNNTGAINLIAGTPSIDCRFQGISISGSSTATYSVANNNIGSTTTANSINVGISSTAQSALYGVRNFGSGTASITGNNIQNCTVSSANASSTLTAIWVTGGTGALSISSNTIISCTIANGGALQGIYNTAAVTTLTIADNIIRNNVISSTSGVFTGIANAGAVTTSITINNNKLGNATAGLVTYTAANSSNLTGIWNFGGAATATLAIQGNNFQGIVNNVQGTGNHTYISNTAPTLSQNISTNTFTNLTANITSPGGDVIFISNNVSVGATGFKTINDNSIVGNFTKTGAGTNLYFYYDAGTSSTGATILNDNNNFSSVTITGAILLQGWSNTDGGVNNPTKNITNNTFSNITAIGSNVFILQISGGSGNVNNNTVTNLTLASNATGISIGAGTFNIYSNAVNTFSSTGGTVTGITIAAASTAPSVYYNTIFGLSSSGVGFNANGIIVAGGTTVRIYKNKIYGLSESSATCLVIGINIAGGTTVYVYNNLIGAFTAPAANLDDAVRGIYVSAGSNVNIYYNTIYLNTTGGANFGSSALSVTTTPTLDLRNNILINTSAPAGTGKTVVFRRSNNVLTTYAATSNNNFFYAGTPALARLIYYDGASDQTLAAFQTRVSPRDNASQSAALTFISTIGTSANFLHLNVASVAANGAANIAGFTDDYDDEIRQGNIGYAGTGTAPDIGADEYEVVACGTTPTITGIITGAPYYAGDAITIQGTDLLNITYATINNIDVVIGAKTLTTAVLTIPVTMTDSVGVIQVARASSCIFSNTFNFVYSGFITKGSQGVGLLWNTNTIWRNNALPVANAPAIINTGDFVALNVSADPIKFTILTGASLTHATSNSFIFGATYLNNTVVNGDLIIDNGTVLTSSNRFISTKLVVTGTGTFTNNSAFATAVNIANFYLDAGGTYTHNAVGSTAAGLLVDFPGTGTRSFGNTSNVIVTKWANGNSSPIYLPASGNPGWGNLTISVATLAGSWNQQGNLTKVQGNLNITATGGFEFRMVAGTGAVTTDIGGNLSVSGGILKGTSGTSASTINVTGNILISGTGSIIGRSGSGTYTLNGIGVASNMTVAAGATYTPATSSGPTNVTAITGAFTVNGGTVTSPGSNHVYTYSMASLAVSSGTFGMSSSSGSTLTITSSGNISVSGTGSVASTSTGNITISCGGDYTQTSSSASALQLQNGTAGTHLMIIGGNFAVSGSGLFKGGGSSADSIIFKGGAASVTYNGLAANMHTGGSPNIKNNFSLYPGKTLTLLTSILPTSSSTSNNWSFIVNTGATLDCSTFEIGTNAATPRTNFTLQTGATLKTANVGGVFGTTTGTASITTTIALASFSSGATYVFNGASAQVTSAFTTTPTTSTVANMVINNSAGVTLSASYDVTAALQMQTGTLTLSTFNLTTATITGSPYSNAKMVNTNSTGALGLPVAAGASTVLFPVGNGTDYTPANYTFTANSTARYLNVRAAKPRNVNDVSATNYINNRWWNTDLSVTTGTYSYTAVYTYITGDMVGTAASIRLNRWTGSAWVNDAASVINNATFTMTSGTLNESSGTLSATAEWVGRVYVAPAIYHWTNTVNGLWTDPTKWTPNGVPGSGDGVWFDAVGGLPYVVTNMPTALSLTQLTVSNNNVFNLSASGTSAVTLIYPGTATPQLSVASGSFMTIDGTNAVTLTLPTNATGNIAGSLNIQRALHRILVSSVNSLIIPSGGYFSYGSTSLLGFSGNPFGTTGTNGAVIFQSGSTCECFEGSNPFGAVATDKITTFNSGSLFRYSDPLPASLPSASGRTYSNFTYNANKTATMAAAASSFICDTLSVTIGSIDFNLQGTPTPDHSVRGNINVATGASLTFSPSVAGTVNMNSGGTQILWGGGVFSVRNSATLDINSGTTVSYQNSPSVIGSGNIAINGTLICIGENTITSSGSVLLNSTGTLSIQSINGISSSFVGNIRCNTFTYSTGGNFIYSGTSNQVTGNRLPVTLNSPSTLTIANTGTAPTNVVTLTTSNTTTPRINLNQGQFNAGTGGTLIINGGTNIVSGGGGNQYLAGAATDNIIRFATNGAVQGTPELYNVTIGTSGGGVDFTNNARINGILLINSGGFVNPNAPKYQTGSTLMYNTGSGYNRSLEWGNNSGLGNAGYPHHVTIQNGTSLDFLAPAFDIGCGGDLTLGTSTAGTLVLSSYVQPSDLFVKGNINIGGTPGTGTLTMSNSVGCDLYLTGNWTRNANGTVNFGGGNGRSVYFEGSTDATITATGGQMFPYLRMQKSAKATKVTLADHVSIKFEATFTRGTLDLGTNNKFFTILSNALTDGRVDVSDPLNTDFIYGTDDRFGQFIVQRYVPARRSWRLVAAPFSGIGTHSVSEAWQERGLPTYATGLDYTSANWAASVTADSISNNFGTQITGGLASNGFDQSPNNNPSIKLYSSGAWIGPSTPINTASVRSQDGWMLFLRGDRKTYGEITNQYKTPTITTLRPRGRIFIGSKTMISSGMTVVGNPYASAVDYFAMSRTGGVWPANPTYYVWDPYLGGATGQGAFVTLTWNGTDFTRASPYGVGTYDNRYIPSGAAIMVDFPTGGTSQLQIDEADKNTDSNTTAFRPAAQHQMMTVLNTVNADNSTYVSDGALSLFDNSFNNDADVNDPRKLTNFAETFALQRNGKLLSIERKKIVTDGDTIFYSLQKMQAKKYQLQFIMDNPGAPASLTAFLEDQYLKTKTPVSLSDTTRIDFRITSDADAKADRFRLVFRNAVKYTALNAFVLNSDIEVDWKVADEFNIKEYILERSTDGNTFTTAGTVLASGDSKDPVNYKWIDAKPQPGEYFYRIRGVSNNGAVAYSDVVKVTIVKGSPGLYVFPNPVSGNTIKLQMNDKPAGQYGVRLINGAGQSLYSKTIQHAGGTATKKIEPEQGLINGVYNLEVTTPAKTITVIKVVVNR